MVFTEKEDVRKTLEKQLQLLSECSEKARFSSEIAELTEAMVQVSDRLCNGLEHYETCDLVNELVKREGVTERTLAPNESITLTVEGPARLLNVFD